jgi:hypothetical protein
MSDFVLQFKNFTLKIPVTLWKSPSFYYLLGVVNTLATVYVTYCLLKKDFED